MGQNTSNSVWKPCEDLQKTFDLCHCQQRVYNKVLRWNFVIDQILIFHHNLQINSLKILQCDFLDFFSYFVSHSWGIPMMKITGLSHLFKGENQHNWWVTKYFFAPLYALYFECAKASQPVRLLLTKTAKNCFSATEIKPSIHTSIHTSVHSSVHPSIHPPVHPSSLSNLSISSQFTQIYIYFCSVFSYKK